MTLLEEEAGMFYAQAGTTGGDGTMRGKKKQHLEFAVDGFRVSSLGPLLLSVFRDLECGILAYILDSCFGSSGLRPLIWWIESYQDG